MPITEVYKDRAELLAAFNFSDIQEGTGVVAFLGALTQQHTTKTYNLTTNSSLYSNDLYTPVGTPQHAAPATKTIDLDFDVEFNLPQRIKGTAIVTATVGLSTHTGNTYVYYIAKIRKWDGSNETEIANAQSETVTFTGVDAQTLTVQIPITTVQQFATGETLRVTMEVWSYVPAGTSTTIIYHDPIGRDDAILGTDDTSTLTAFIPFELDL